MANDYLKRFVRSVKQRRGSRQTLYKSYREDRARRSRCPYLYCSLVRSNRVHRHSTFDRLFTAERSVCRRRHVHRTIAVEYGVKYGRPTPVMRP